MPVAKTPSNLEKFDVTGCRFDSAKSLASGSDFVLPVDSPDEGTRCQSPLRTWQ